MNISFYVYFINLLKRFDIKTMENDLYIFYCVK